MPRKTKPPKAPTVAQTKKADDTDRVNFVVDRFNSSWEYCQNNYHTVWGDAWKLYNNKRVKIGYEGYSDIFVPMTFSTIQTMVAALAGGKPSFDFLPPKDRPEQNTDILNALLDNYWDKDQWNIKVQNWIQSMLLYGTGVVYLQWTGDHPVMVNVPLRDFFFNPNAVSMENCGSDFYAGRRYLSTLDELKSYEVADPDDLDDDGTPKMKPKYKNLDDVPEDASGQHGDETDKERKDLFYGSTAPDPEHSQVECLEMWNDDRVVTVLNRSVLIQDDENPYKARAKERGYDNPKGIIPFIAQRDYVDESLFLGRGEVETFADLQEDLNDSRNMKRDYLAYALDPTSRLNPMKSDMIEEVGAARGRVIPLDAGDFEYLPLPPLPNGAFDEEINLKNEIRETVAIDQVVKGVGQDSSTTATEVNAQIASAGQRLGMKITQLENEGFHRLARVVFEMVKLYVTEPMLVRVVGDGVSWEQFDPEEFQGEYEPRVQLENTVEAKREKDISKAQEMFLALAVDPDVNQQELKRMLLPKMFDLDPDEVDRLLTPPEQPMGMGGMDPMVGGMPPAQGPEPMMDALVDPVTGELMPAAQEPLPQEVML